MWYHGLALYGLAVVALLGCLGLSDASREFPAQRRQLQAAGMGAPAGSKVHASIWSQPGYRQHALPLALLAILM